MRGPFVKNSRWSAGFTGWAVRANFLYRLRSRSSAVVPVLNSATYGVDWCPVRLLRMATKPQKPDFEKHIAELPQSVDELAADVLILAAEGEELQAESILRLALRNHSSGKLRISLAHVLIRQNRHKEAMTEMVAVLRGDPENADALMVLATCLIACDELDRGGKMLQKARLAGVNESQAMELEHHWRELVAKSTDPGFADLTLPDIGAGVVEKAPPEEQARKRHETLMGRPTTGPSEAPSFDVGDPTGRTAPPAQNPSGGSRRLPPPPLQSGTFASLDTWDIDDADENDLDTTAIAPEKVRLTDEGPLERIPIPPSAADSSGEYAAPNDMTAAIILDESELAEPDEPTQHLPFEHVERGMRELAERDDGTVERDLEEMPSVEYDANFAAEARQHQQPVSAEHHAPPADLDDLPSWDADINGMPDEQWSDYQAQPAAADFAQDLGERPVAQSPLDYGDWNDIPQMQPNAQPDFDGFDARPAPAPADPAPHFEVQRNAPPAAAAPLDFGPPPGRREETAVAATPTQAPNTSASMRILVENRWILVLVIFLAVVLVGFLSVTVASGWSLASALTSGMQAASAARETDTFKGYETAEQELVQATKTNSFMGSGFDRFVETTLPIPGLSGANLRRRSVADLAAVAATLEYRFEKPGSREAQARLATAKELAPDEPATAVAEAYIALAANDPARALEILTAARNQHAGEPRLAEALGWAQLALGRVADASKTVQDLRSVPAPSVQQRYLLATVDAARGDTKAAEAFAEVFAASPDHADARIGRAYALLGGDEKATEDAQKALDAVLTKLADSASTYQKARATSAYGSLYITTGKPDAAEERFRSSVAKMPTRGELYLPLVRFLDRSDKRDEVDALLDKARSNNAMVPDLVLYEAERRIMQSQPEKALEVLETLSFEDGRRSFLHGLALIDQFKPKAAREVLEKGQNAPGDPVPTQALYYVARSLASEEAVEDATYQLDRIKSKNADNAIVHWASAMVSATAAEVTNSKKTRGEQLESARKDIERAFELDPSFAPIHFTRCDILQRDLKMEAAEEFCFSGRKLAPEYAPGLVTTARLRLMEGKFDDANELTKQALKLRPNDPVVGLLTARVAIERRDFEKGREHINRWLGKAVDRYELSLLEGRLEFARENYTRAAGYLKEAFELRPNAGEASIYYGHTLARLGDFKNASKLLREYLSHPTWSGYAWAALGEVRRKQRKLKDAYQNLDKAIAIYDEQEVPARYWSHVYTEYALTNRLQYRKWSHPTVKRMLNRGRKKGDPDDPGLNMAFGEYYLNLRRPDYGEAMKHIQKVVDVAPYRCDAVTALQTLYKRAERDQEQIAAIDNIYANNCAAEQ